MRFLLISFLLTGCFFDGSSRAVQDDGSVEEIDAANDIDASAQDAAVDAAVDASMADAADFDADVDAQSCVGDELPFNPTNIDSCDVPMPGVGLLLDEPGTYILDTSLGELLPPVGAAVALGGDTVAQANGVDLYVLSYQSITIGSSSVVKVVGSKALMAISFGDITIDGELSANGSGSDDGAAGDLDVVCSTGRGATGPIQDNNSGEDGGAGGGGGGFGTIGGVGGKVDHNGGGADSGNNPVTAAGIASVDTDLVPLRGGCAGGAGGNTSALAGGAGGAIELIAAGEIAIDGILSVSGGGGSGQSTGDMYAGGGGGGSGGGILLHAGTILIDGGKVTANGGAGGEGTRRGIDSGPGEDGSLDGDSPAEGGSGLSSGGNGGNGGSLGNAATEGVGGESDNGAAAGGGGGGGAYGRIRFISVGATTVQGGAIVSPAAP